MREVVEISGGQAGRELTPDEERALQTLASDTGLAFVLLPPQSTATISSGTALKVVFGSEAKLRRSRA